MFDLRVMAPRTPAHEVFTNFDGEGWQNTGIAFLVALTGPSAWLAHRFDQRCGPPPYGTNHLPVYHTRRLPRQPQHLREPVNRELRLEARERDLARLGQNPNRHVRQVALLDRAQIEQRHRVVQRARDGADVVGHGHARVDQRERRGVDGGLEERSVRLEDLDVDCDLATRVEVCLDDGLERRLDVLRKLERPSCM